MRRHADVPLWVCVGDVASNDGEYFAPLAPLYFIKGNNEDFDVLARAVSGEPPARAAALHAQRRPVQRRAVAGRGAGRHVRAELVQLVGRRAAAVARAQDLGRHR